MSSDPGTHDPDRRFIALERGCNFRDMGGYATRCGRIVRWRTLFRSGVLDQLTQQDCRTLSELSIAAVVDLRGNGEREQRPSKPFGAARIWARDYGMSHADYSRPAAIATPEQRKRRMIKVYRTMLKEQAEGYRELLQTLDVATGPVLFHCTGGKDRTGVGAALLLDILDVPRDVIVADYDLTNGLFIRDAAVLNALSPPSPPELVAADPAYLSAMFESLDQEFGGSAGYVKSLGMDEMLGERLRDKYLQA